MLEANEEWWGTNRPKRRSIWDMPEDFEEEQDRQFCSSLLWRKIEALAADAGERISVHTDLLYDMVTLKRSANRFFIVYPFAKGTGIGFPVGAQQSEAGRSGIPRYESRSSQAEYEKTIFRRSLVFLDCHEGWAAIAGIESIQKETLDLWIPVRVLAEKFRYEALSKKPLQTVKMTDGKSQTFIRRFETLSDDSLKASKNARNLQYRKGLTCFLDEQSLVDYKKKL